MKRKKQTSTARSNFSQNILGGKPGHIKLARCARKNRGEEIELHMRPRGIYCTVERLYWKKPYIFLLSSCLNPTPLFPLN